MIREELLSCLRNGKTISGEEFSRRFGLSRAAVWKTVDSLRKEGYVIEARTGLGYRLVKTPDVLSEQEIRSFLGQIEIVGKDLYCFDEIDSTNTFIKKLSVSGGREGAVAVANCQTAGRGRMDRTFQSPKDKGVYLSVLLQPDMAPEKSLTVPAMAGVAVCNAIERVCGARPGLKWPNDPVLNGRKVCGILTEVSLEGETGTIQFLTVGIGINVSQTDADFSPDVAKMATSLVQELKHPVSRPALAAALIEELDRLYINLKQGNSRDYLEACRRDCVTLGKQVRILSAARRNPPEAGQDRPSNPDEETVTAIDLDDQFGLIVRDSHGNQRVIRSGEVSVRGLYGYTD